MAIMHRAIAASGAKLSLVPLPSLLRRGLLGPGIVGLCSALATTALISFLVYKMVLWKRNHKSFAGYNQYIVLILNLLVADFFQALAFILSFHWIQLDAILHDDPVCFTQGWFLNLGDTASGLFVFGIACHTFYATIKGRRMGARVFTAAVALTWAFAILITALGPIIHHDRYFTQAGAWCWAAARYETERLMFHYVWVFAVEFGTVLVYLAVFVYLKRSVRFINRTSMNTSTTARIDRAAKLMVLFPVFYIVCTLPLSAGRMWSMAHGGRSVPPAYACVVGSLMASTGLIDTLLYTLTRRALISSSPTTYGSSRRTEGMTDMSTRRKSEFLTSALSPTDVDDEDDKKSTTYLSPINSGPSPPSAHGNIHVTKTVTMVDVRRSSTCTLVEERQMAWRESRHLFSGSSTRPTLRSFSSNDPLTVPVAHEELSQRNMSVGPLASMPSVSSPLRVGVLQSYDDDLNLHSPTLGNMDSFESIKEEYNVTETQRNGSADSTSI